MTCSHLEFITTTRVHTCESGRRYISLMLRCGHCGELAQFVGLPNRIDVNGAFVSQDGKEARLAIAMSNVPEVRDWQPLRLFLAQASTTVGI